jgi:hypothetical protein
LGAERSRLDGEACRRVAGSVGARKETLTELAEGRGAEPTEAIELLLRVVAGDADRLSGRHLSVPDDLDMVLARIDEVQAHDHYVLRPERLLYAS